MIHKYTNYLDRVNDLSIASLPSRVMLNREYRGYQKPDPGGDHYYVGCLE